MQVFYDVIQKRLNIYTVGIHVAFFYTVYFYTDAIKSLFQLDFIVRAYILTYQSACISVRNGSIVEIGVYVISENVLCIIFLADDWRASQGNLDGIRIARNEIFQETSVWAIITVCLVYEVDALHRHIIGILCQSLRIVGELLYVDNGDFGLALSVLSCQTTTDNSCKIIFSLNGVDFQTTIRKLPLRLYHQIQTVNDEEELWNNPL